MVASLYLYIVQVSCDEPDHACARTMHRVVLAHSPAAAAEGFRSDVHSTRTGRLGMFNPDTSGAWIVGTAADARSDASQLLDGPYVIA